MLAASSRRLFPFQDRTWVRGGGGIAKGLYFKLNVRFEADFLKEGPPDLERVWTENLTPGTVFYDVGSHVGVFAVSAARMVGASGAVYAFEPDPENCALIVEHAQRNLLQVQVVPKAAWKSNGRLTFVEAGVSDPGRMGGHLSKDAAAPNARTVDTVTLDEFVQDHRPPTFIKLDVEGAEAEVLEGAEHTLLTFSPVLLIEIHNRDAHRRVAQFLLERGYGFIQVVPQVPQFVARRRSSSHP